MGGENIVVAVVIIISPYYRAVGCIKMGKHKFTDEIAQRKRQKAKHKLKIIACIERATVLRANDTHVTRAGIKQVKACLPIHN